MLRSVFAIIRANPCWSATCVFPRPSRTSRFSVTPWRLLAVSASKLRNNQEFAMDKDRVKGAAHEVKGGLKETAGKVQNAVGGAKDAMKK